MKTEKEIFEKVDKINELPKNWRIIDGQKIYINGLYYVWVNNNKSLFERGYKHAFLKVEV